MSEFFEMLQRPDSPVGLADMLYALLLLAGLVRGFFRGVSGEIAATLGSILTFFGAWKFHRPVGDFLLANTRMDNSVAARGVSYVLLVLVFLFTWKGIIWLLRKVFERAVPDHVERPLGALLGLIKNTVFLCGVLMMVGLTGSKMLREPLIERSAFGRGTQILLPGLLQRWLPNAFPAESAAPVPEPSATPHGSGNP